MAPIAFDENERENGCPYRESYLHDGGEYYLCRRKFDEDCIDSFSDKFCCGEGEED